MHILFILKKNIEVFIKIFLCASLFLCLSCSHLFRKPQSKAKRKVQLGRLNTIKKEKKVEWHIEITQTEKAWQLSQGDKNIVVAIIDTGVDTQHPDLKDNLWVNQKELKGKPGVDDDLNGFVDDIHGWNFAENNSNIQDSHGHGTHVAGIIGSRGNKCKSGVAPKVSLMILKYYKPKARGSENLRNTIQSIHYAVNNGAHIINFSGGGSEPSEQEREAIEKALEKNVLFVTAGGNERSNIENKPYYPASYNLPNIFSVGASNTHDEHSSFSNEGGSIMAHAPGVKLYSTLPPSRCGYLTGTSQSTPIFTGGAVLVKAAKKLSKVQDIIKYLHKTTDQKEQLKGKNQSGGRANIYRAVGSEHFDITINGSKIQHHYGDNLGEIPEEGKARNTLPKDSLSIIEEPLVSSKDLSKRNPASFYEKNVIAPSVWTFLFSSEFQQ